MKSSSISQFRLGDRVKYNAGTGSNSEWSGLIGKVTYIYKSTVNFTPENHPNPNVVSCGCSWVLLSLADGEIEGSEYADEQL